MSRIGKITHLVDGSRTGVPCSMKQVTQAWVEKAEDDLLLAQQSLASSAPVADGICFHAQQCAEKYLKALLQERDIPFPRTHDLSHLETLFTGAVPALTNLRPALIWLSTYAVEIRYPGSHATLAEAERALAIAVDTRDVIRTELGLPGVETTSPATEPTSPDAPDHDRSTR